MCPEEHICAQKKGLTTILSKVAYLIFTSYVKCFLCLLNIYECQVDILDKHEDLYVRKKPIPIPKKCATYKSIFEVLQSINETNFANLWTEANGDTSEETSIRLEDFEVRNLFVV